MVNYMLSMIKYIWDTFYDDFSINICTLTYISTPPTHTHIFLYLAGDNIWSIYFYTGTAYLELRTCIYIAMEFI